MFGYIVIHEPELRVREVELYRSYYCGLCRDLLETYGRAGQLTLSFDTAFLALLLTSLYEPAEETVTQAHCLPHPFRRHTERRNGFTRYAADMTILLAWYAGRDDWEDERKWKGLALSGILQSGFRKASERHPEKAARIAECLQRLHEIESGPAGEDGDPDSGGAAADAAGACFGELLGCLFACYRDDWEIPLYRMGFYLGKFIYLLDAYDDLERDAASGSFNPLLSVRAGMQDEDAGLSAQETDRSPETSFPFDSYVRALLTMLMASCTRAFEALPIVENVDILRNILYAGVWTRFEQVFAERTRSPAEAGQEEPDTTEAGQEEPGSAEDGQTEPGSAEDAQTEPDAAETGDPEDAQTEPGTADAGKTEPGQTAPAGPPSPDPAFFSGEEKQ